MKSLVAAVLIGGAALGPTPPPGPPLPGPPPILEPVGPSATLPGLTALPTEPGTLPPVATPQAPSGRPSASPAAASAGAPAATVAPSAGAVSPSPASVEASSTGSGRWIVVGIVLALAAAVTWLFVRRRRHAQS
ncbi:hypothetical protein ACQP1P_45970 [Dactylosporangium sp. CA-052675]|uniref:hypothetical protein n=1 Tax=Dactylosporangium sp. CA-052675 TaxID=3239927 RepID=UPI003D8D1A55